MPMRFCHPRTDESPPYLHGRVLAEIVGNQTRSIRHKEPPYGALSITASSLDENVLRNVPKNSVPPPQDGVGTNDTLPRYPRLIGVTLLELLLPQRVPPIPYSLVSFISIQSRGLW